MSIDAENPDRPSAGHAPSSIAVFDALDQPVTLLSLDGVFRHLNGAALALMDKRAEDLLGRSYLEVFPDVAGRPFHGAFERVASGASTHEHLETFYEPMGMWSDQRIVRADGFVVVLWDDITARKAAAEERGYVARTTELLARTTAVMSSSLDYEATLARIVRVAVPTLADACCVYVVAADGAIEQVAVAGHDDVAAAAQAMCPEGPLDADAGFGYPRVIRTSTTELVSAIDDGPSRGERGPAHVEVVREIGSKSWIIAPLRAPGRTLGAIAFTLTGDRRYAQRDVQVAEEIARRAALALENARLYRHARDAVDAERRARDKAEQATRLKDEFLATLSHELRTPLNAILGWARMLQAGSVPEERRPTAIDVIVRNATAQNQLIEDLLDISRIVTGNLRLNVESVDIELILHSAMDAVRPAAEAKGVRLQMSLEGAGRVFGDAGRLQQIVWNLLTNAVKFTPRGGRVDVSLSRDDSCIELAVTDTGAGIARSFLPYVFDRFRQEDAAITRKTGGLGLGLAIVKNLVELHGGTVEATSDGEGRGATFVVRIPIAPARSAPFVRPEPARAPSHAAVELDGLTILVIDDEADARELVRAVLESLRATVVTAASAAEGLDVAANERPDVIVCDIGMPSADGYGFIRALRSRSREDGGAAPAIALTAYARPEDRARAVAAGFQSHAGKPIDPDDLVLMIGSLAGRSA